MKFRKLKAEEIDVKIGSVGKKGYTLLLYKNARVDMAILDETVGAENWQNKFYEVCGNLYCSVGINCALMQENKVVDRWIWKDDCGVESAFGDKEKGQASDARKRAGFAWGIGRELYTSPLIYIFAKTTYNESKRCYELEQEEKNRRFKVNEISYNERDEIEDLVISDLEGNVAFATDGYRRAYKEQKEETTKQVETTSEIKCEDCKVGVTDKVANYSKDKYGKVLCYKCQKLQPQQSKEL
jgi:hypothetical protein